MVFVKIHSKQQEAYSEIFIHFVDGSIIICFILHFLVLIIVTDFMNILSPSPFLFSQPGARLHHQLPEEGDAVSVWEGEEEGGTDHEASRNLHTATERAPHLPWRLPQRRQDAGLVGRGEREAYMQR